MEWLEPIAKAISYVVMEWLEPIAKGVGLIFTIFSAFTVISNYIEKMQIPRIFNCGLLVVEGLKG